MTTNGLRREDEGLLRARRDATCPGRGVKPPARDHSTKSFQVVCAPRKQTSLPYLLLTPIYYLVFVYRLQVQLSIRIISYIQPPPKLFPFTFPLTLHARYEYLKLHIHLPPFPVLLSFPLYTFYMFYTVKILQLTTND